MSSGQGQEDLGQELLGGLQLLNHLVRKLHCEVNFKVLEKMIRPLSL